MDSTDITEKGLRDLQTMNQLKRLSLAGTELTDDAMVLFHTMGALQTLDVRNTKINQQAAQRLAATRPELQLRTDWTSSDLEKERRRLHLESYLNRFEDQYRLKLLEYQKRYFGFSARAETTGI